jgi:hypothetical protein
LVVLGLLADPGGLDPAALRRIEAIIDDATALGLAVAVSNHLPEKMASTRRPTSPPRSPMPAS